MIQSARSCAKDRQWMAAFYRREGHEAEAEILDAEADWYSQLADDEEVGLRRVIRRESGIVHQMPGNLQHG